MTPNASYETLAVYGVIAVAALVVLSFLFSFLKSSIVFIKNDEYGIVERRFAGGRKPEPFAPIALNGGAGFLPDVLRGGWHFLTPYKYVVHTRPLISIDQIAYLVARVGKPLSPGQVLGQWPEEAGEADDVRGFLEKGGQAGPQRRMLRTGTYAINTALFNVISGTDEGILSFDATTHSRDDQKILEALRSRNAFSPVLIDQDQIGIVTVQDGPALTHGEIIAPAVGIDTNSAGTFHNSFQDMRAFMAAGGRRGRQEQVLVEGTYFINRLFATVEVQPKTKIAIGEVGVVNSFVGTAPEASVDGGRGRTVDRGQRGVCREPLQPGKYAINPYAMEIIKVPVTNFVLKFIEGETSGSPTPGTRAYDSDLKEIEVITKDAFEVKLALSIVAHISAANAPHVIQRFSDVNKFVSQTLDPFVSQYFRDSAQRRTLIEFIQNREEITQEALTAMKERMSEHRIEIEEVMIGTPSGSSKDKGSMELQLNQLRLRQIAIEEQETFKGQQETAKAKRSLNEQQALADQQSGITKSKLAIDIARNEGLAETERMKSAAEGIVVQAKAEADAAKLRMEAVGGAENMIRQAAIQAAVEIARSGGQLVPQVMVSGADANGASGAMMGLFLKELAPKPDARAKDGAGADPRRLNGAASPA